MAAESKNFHLQSIPTDWPLHNLASYSNPEHVAVYASISDLMPGEAVVFEKYASVLNTSRVLDIGVGGGRTTLYLKDKCRSYRAVDYSDEMISACRRRFPALPAETFSVCDARDLSNEPSAGYDFICFSFCGIDYVKQEDRGRVFAAVKRVLARGGYFFFSTHSLYAWPFLDSAIVDKNKHINDTEIAERGWCYLIDYEDRLVTYYSYPSFQASLLRESGFTVVDVLDSNGHGYNFDCPQRDWVVYFVCQNNF